MKVWRLIVTLFIVCVLGKRQDSESELHKSREIVEEEQIEAHKTGGIARAHATTAVQPDSLGKHVGHVPGHEGRGGGFYDDTSVSVTESKEIDNGTSISAGDVLKTNHSEMVSSKETIESMRKRRTWRECTVCPLDMVRKHSSRGIRWICGEYQQAKRTFKSICMMHYRNCQDGTMFKKISNGRCVDGNYHGKHWFYVYKV